MDNSSSIERPVVLNGTFYEVLTEKNEIVVARCILCKTDKCEEKHISGSYKHTSNFRTHIKQLHSGKLEEYEQLVKSHISKKVKNKHLGTPKQKLLKLDFNKSLSVSKQQLLDKNIMNYVKNSMKPLSTVENDDFKRIIHELDSNVKVISRRKLTKNISEEYESTTENLKLFFQKHQQIYICTTADIWSTKHRSFLGITGHWIEPNTLERRGCVLACRRFAGNHSFDKIADLMTDIFSEFHLTCDQILSTITDNGSNFVKAFKEFGFKTKFISDESDEEDEDDNEELTFVPIQENLDTFSLPRHLRCASHTLSLLATTDFNNILKSSSVSRYHHPVLAKCSALWNASRKPKSSEIICNILNCTLTFPVITRWNSLYDSISHLLKFKEKLNNLTKELGLKFHFKEVDIDYLLEYVQIMKPIAIALDHLQGETNVFYGQLIPTLFSLRIRLQSLKEQNFRYAANPIDPLLKALEKRFILFFDLSPEVNEAILASCFHPAFKLRWVPEKNDVEKKKNSKFVY